MEFRCDSCGQVNYVLMDGYYIGDRFLEGVMFDIIVEKDSLDVILKAYVHDKLYFKDNGINAKKWEKEMIKYAYDDYKENGCCDMICPLCGEHEVITIAEE